MSLLKPDLDPSDPVIDFEEHMRRFLDGTLEADVLTKGYNRTDLDRITRQVENSIAAGSYKTPRYLPGVTADEAALLPWARDEEDAGRAALTAGSGSDSGAGSAARSGAAAAAPSVPAVLPSGSLSLREDPAGYAAAKIAAAGRRGGAPAGKLA
jgi:hypothetical protein